MNLVYRVKAAIRFAVFHLLRPFVTQWEYTNPADVAGYRGGYNIGKRTIVFVREDGSNQYFW